MQNDYVVGELYQLAPPISATIEFNGFSCYEVTTSSFDEFVWIKCNKPCLFLGHDKEDGHWLIFLGEDWNSNFVEFALSFDKNRIQPWTYHET